jgi:hypothetical protein
MTFDEEPRVKTYDIEVQRLAHRKFKRPPKPDDQTAASQDGPRRDVCGSEIVAAAPIRTVSPLPLGLVGPDLRSRS